MRMWFLPRPSSKVKVPDPKLPFSQQDEAVLLAMLGWGEARNQSDAGLAAVQHVVLTRRDIKKSLIATEILRKWAFSAFNLKDPNRPKLLLPLKYGALKDWERCLASAEGVLSGSILNPVPGATHYVVRKYWLAAPQPRAEWYDLNEVASGRTKKLAVIGEHVFACAPF